MQRAQEVAANAQVQFSTAGEEPLSVAVVVPVFRGGELLHRCLQSIAATSPAPREVLVVLDGDEPEDRETAQKFPVRVLSLPENKGPAAARNLGARSVLADILFFVDSDVQVPPDAIAKVRDAFHGEGPELAAVIGSYDDKPSAQGFLSQYKNLAHHFVHQQGEQDAYTFWGACGAIRRDTLLSCGGFSEAFTRPSIEDIELGYRLKAAGCRIRLRKDLQVTHGKRWTFLSLLATDVFRRAVPWTRLLLAHGRMEDDLNISSRERVKVVLAWMALASVIAAAPVPPVALVVPACLLGLFLLDRPFIRFFSARRGTVFAIRAWMWHCFYYLYSGFGFVAGACLYSRDRLTDWGRRKKTKS